MFRFLLFPFQWLYVLAISLNKLMFLIGIKKRYAFSIPTICIGNLNTGGSGKTPHSKYIAKLLLNQKHSPAILLRGYKRKTKGFIHCNTSHTIKDIGDEAYEYVNGLPDSINIFVCEKRKKAIKTIQKKFPNITAIIMDDGFQHLSVMAGMYILLTDYLNPYWKDHILPIGKLREPKCAKNRANIILISKTPKVFSPIVRRSLIEKIKPNHLQNIAFSYLKYSEFEKVYIDSTYNDNLPNNLYSIFLLSAIENTYPLEEHLKNKCVELYKHCYNDHHIFDLEDIGNLVKDFSKHITKNKIIVTTEKDIAKLMLPEIKEKLINLPLFYISVSVAIHKNEEFNLDKTIINYVKKN